MREEAINRTVSFAFEAWLDQIEAQASGAPNPIAQQCGAWLLLRRAELGLTQAMIHERTGIEPWQLALLEAGMAGAESLPEQCLFRLCLVLEGTQRDLPWVAAVMHLALGYASDGAERVAERVTAELEAACIEEAAQQAEATRIPELNDEQYYVLSAYAGEPLNAIGVRSAIAKRWNNTIKIELPTIWAVTQDLLAYNILVAAGDQAGLPSYQTAEPLGSEVLLFEEEARAVREREHQATEARRQLEQRRRELQKGRSGSRWRKSPA